MSGPTSGKVKLPSASDVAGFFRQATGGDAADAEPVEELSAEAAVESDGPAIADLVSEVVQTRANLAAAQLEILPRRVFRGAVAAAVGALNDARDEPERNVRSRRARLAQEKLALAEQAMAEAKQFAAAAETPAQERAAAQKKSAARQLAKEAQLAVDRLLADAAPVASAAAEEAAAPVLDTGDDTILGMVKGVLDTSAELAAARVERARVQAQRSVRR